MSFDTKREKHKRSLINTLISGLDLVGFQEICLQSFETYPKVDLLHSYQIEKSNVYLRQTGKDTIRDYLDYVSAEEHRYFYVTQCWLKNTRPKHGNYREFTEFGAVILNISQDYVNSFLEHIKHILNEYKINSLSFEKTSNGWKFFDNDFGDIIVGDFEERFAIIRINIDRLIDYDIK